jgi:hypothetical protein
MFSKIFAPIMMLLVFSGCYSIYDVHRDTNSGKENEQGIPFYVKKGRLVQQTTYARSWIDVTLSMNEMDENNNPKGKPLTQKYYFDENSYDDAKVLAAYMAASGVASSGDFVAATEKFYSALDSDIISPGELSRELDPKLSTKPAHLVESLISNTVTMESYVDYGSVWYFNTDASVLGSATSEIDLNEDGTLTKGSSNVDNSKTADILTSVLGLLPVKELLMKKWALQSAAAVKALGKRYVLTIDAAKDGCNYILTAYHQFSNDTGSHFAPLTFSEKTYVSVVPFGKSSESGNSQSDTVKVNGRVVLPGKE